VRMVMHKHQAVLAWGKLTRVRRPADPSEVIVSRGLTKISGQGSNDVH
jgi:hypothetical protein